MDWMKVPHVQRLPPTAANLTAAETGTDLDTEGKIDFGFFDFPHSLIFFSSIKISCGKYYPALFPFLSGCKQPKGHCSFIVILFESSCSFLI